MLDAKEVFLIPFFEFGHREIFDHFLVSALSFLPGLLHDGEAGVEPTTEHSDEQFQFTLLIHGLFLVILSFCPFQWGGVCLGKRTNLVVTSESRRVIAVSLRHETTGQFFAFFSSNEVFRPSELSWKCVPRLPRRSLAAHFFANMGDLGDFSGNVGGKGA